MTHPSCRIDDNQKRAIDPEKCLPKTNKKRKNLNELKFPKTLFYPKLKISNNSVSSEKIDIQILPKSKIFKNKDGKTGSRHTTPLLYKGGGTCQMFSHE